MKEKTKRIIKLIALDGSLTPEVFEKLRKSDAMVSEDDWDEHKHPRGKGGKFTSKGGAGGGSSSETSESGSSGQAAKSEPISKPKTKRPGSGNWGHSGVKKQLGGSAKSGSGGRVSGNVGKNLAGEEFKGKDYSLRARGLSSTKRLGKNNPGKKWSTAGKPSKTFPKGSGTTTISEGDVGKGLHTINRYLTADGQLTPERAELHDKIVNKLFEGKKPKGEGEQKTFYFLGGGSASGKSSFTNQRSSIYGMPNSEQVAVVDADALKNELPEYNWDEKTQTGTGTTDRNKAASFAHEESSALAKRAMQAAFENGYDCTLDGTGDGSVEGVLKKIQKARDADYKVEARYCTKDIEAAIQANIARAKKTGRMVQLDSVISIHKTVSEIFPKVASEFDHVELWDHNGPEPVKIAECWRGKEIKVHNQEAYDRFLAKKDYKG